VIAKQDGRGTEAPPPAFGHQGQEQECTMSEKLGEIARESSDYRCERCHEVTRISRGALIPACPHCGYGSYDISNPRFETKDGQLGPHEPG
jgi:DNA-directed RNA polymerase subunit RPC12/RpoP